MPPSPPQAMELLEMAFNNCESSVVATSLLYSELAYALSHRFTPALPLFESATVSTTAGRAPAGRDPARVTIGAPKVPVQPSFSMPVVAWISSRLQLVLEVRALSDVCVCVLCMWCSLTFPPCIPQQGFLYDIGDGNSFGSDQKVVLNCDSHLPCTAWFNLDDKVGEDRGLRSVIMLLPLWVSELVMRT